MKLLAKLIPAVLAVATAVCACSSAPHTLDASTDKAASAHSSISQFSDVSGKEWLLVEIQTRPRNIVIDRAALSEEGSNDIFTLRFEDGRIYGVGAPNRYTSSYTVEDQAISINLIAGTLMAPLFERKDLRESEYYTYVQNAYQWDYSAEQLKLYTKNAAGEEAVLVYSQGNAGK